MDLVDESYDIESQLRKEPIQCAEACIAIVVVFWPNFHEPAVCASASLIAVVADRLLLFLLFRRPKPERLPKTKTLALARIIFRKSRRLTATIIASTLNIKEAPYTPVLFRH